MVSFTSRKCPDFAKYSNLDACSHYIDDLESARRLFKQAFGGEANEPSNRRLSVARFVAGRNAH